MTWCFFKYDIAVSQGQKELCGSVSNYLIFFLVAVPNIFSLNMRRGVAKNMFFKEDDVAVSKVQKSFFF